MYQDLRPAAASMPSRHSQQHLQHLDPKPEDAEDAMLLESPKLVPKLQSLDVQEHAGKTTKNVLLAAPTVPSSCLHEKSQMGSPLYGGPEDSSAACSLIKAVWPGKENAAAHDVHQLPSCGKSAASLVPSPSFSWSNSAGYFMSKLPDFPHAGSLSSVTLEVQQLGTVQGPIVVEGAFKRIERVSLSAQNIYLELTDGVEWAHCVIDAKDMLLLQVSDAPAFVKAVQRLDVCSKMGMGAGLFCIWQALYDSGMEYRIRKAHGRAILTAGGCYYPWM